MPGSSLARRIARVLWAALAAASLLAHPAGAKPWARLAPDSLASDTEYRKLSGRPGWLLDDDDKVWLDIQWSWRAERQQEAGGALWLHEERDTDERFAALIARPQRGLRKADRKWLEQDAYRRWQLASADPRRTRNATDPVTATIAIAGTIYMLWALKQLASSGW